VLGYPARLDVRETSTDAGRSPGRPGPRRLRPAIRESASRAVGRAVAAGSIDVLEGFSRSNHTSLTDAVVSRARSRRMAALGRLRIHHRPAAARRRRLSRRQFGGGASGWRCRRGRTDRRRRAAIFSDQRRLRKGSLRRCGLATDRALDASRGARVTFERKTASFGTRASSRGSSAWPAAPEAFTRDLRRHDTDVSAAIRRAILSLDTLSLVRDSRDRIKSGGFTTRAPSAGRRGPSRAAVSWETGAKAGSSIDRVSYAATFSHERRDLQLQILVATLVTVRMPRPRGVRASSSTSTARPGLP